MRVVTGVKTESSFADPSGLLGDCRHIEAYLPVLVPAADEVQGGPMPDGQSTPWNTALWYFRKAAAKIHRPGARARCGVPSRPRRSLGTGPKRTLRRAQCNRIANSYGHGSASGLLRLIAEGNQKTKPQAALDS